MALLSRFREWADHAGLFHLTKNPGLEQSENPFTFTCTAYVLAMFALKADHHDKMNLDASLAHARTDKLGVFKPTSISKSDHFSHDQATPMVCASKLYGLTYHKELKLFQKHHRHPRDFIFYGYMKGGLHRIWATPLMFIPIIASLVSCYQTHKERNGNLIAKTDGKILALNRAIALSCNDSGILTPLWPYFFMAVWRWTVERERDFPAPRWATQATFGRWKWGEWSMIFDDYFKEEGHPNRELIKDVEEALRE